MRGVILAAGTGSRLRPLTLETSKPCVTVGTMSILARQLRAFADAGVEDVTVVAGYRAADVHRLCEAVEADRSALTVTVRENEVYANTDNLYSLSLAAERVAGEPFVLTNGDVVFERELLADLLAADVDSAIACDTSMYDEESMKVTVDDAGFVTHIDKGIPPEAADGVSTDTYRFSADFSAKLFEEVSRTVERRGEYGDWTEAAIDRILGDRNHGVEPVEVGGHDWVEVDDFDDLHEADVTFSSMSRLDAKDAVFFDLDGTLYLDDDLVDGAAEVVEALRRAGVDVYFLSNNSSRWKDDYVAKLTALGVPATPEDVLLSTDGVLDYVQGVSGEVYVLGTDAMRDALADHGVDVGDDDPDHVVVGFDTELTYEKARTATLAIRDGASFLLAHEDSVCPTAEGFVPDCGAIGALVAEATGRAPDRVFGKPRAGMVEHVLAENGYEPADVAVVGDRLATDVRLAETVGCESVCVLTGDATRVAVERSSVEPTLVAPSVAALERFVSATPDDGPTTVSVEGGDTE